tara:strand:+ start:1634 stop:2455 length:822 start_codon:yes stop_codon:yes gene_type:complete
MNKKLITFSDSFEPETIEYIVHICGGGEHLQGRTYGFDTEYNRPGHVTLLELERVVTSPELNPTWKRAKKYFPNLAFRGQCVLFLAIRSSLRPEGIYVSEREAGIWKDKFLTKIQEARELAEMTPENLNTFMGLHQNLTRSVGDDAYRDSWNNKGEAGRALISLMYGQSNLVSLLDSITHAISQIPYSRKGHASQFKGRNAERAYFVRALSKILMFQTGEWKRSTVAEVTSVAFDCNYTPKEVVRATKDMVARTSARLDTDAEWLDSHWHLFF